MCRRVDGPGKVCIGEVLVSFGQVMLADRHRSVNPVRLVLCIIINDGREETSSYGFRSHARQGWEKEIKCIERVNGNCFEKIEKTK